MVLLDTSLLVDGLPGGCRSAPARRAVLARGERVVVNSLVLFEWRRGARLAEELASQEALWPNESAMAFGADEAVAAALYRALRAPRGREMDIAIAASAICAGAELWTTNRADFQGTPRLSLYAAINSRDLDKL